MYIITIFYINFFPSADSTQPNTGVFSWQEPLRVLQVLEGLEE
jgi:hypothetical protein